MMVPASIVLWKFYRQLAFVQFPWRWMGPLGFAFAVRLWVLLRCVARANSRVGFDGYAC